MRAVSTVADTLVFLVLVSAAVGTLVVVPSSSPSPPPRAESTAETLTTTTLSVPVAATAGDERRRAHGTPAGLLARAALANATLDDRRLLPGALPRRVRSRVRATRPTPDVHLVARWEPYSNASLAGRVAVGSPPPRDVRTDVETVTVPSGVAVTDARLDAAAADGYRPLATLVAERFVDRSFPPGAARSNLADPAVRDRTAARYRRFAAVTGADVRGPLGDGSAATARARLVDALATRLAADMRARFETPSVAADAVRERPGTVRLVVVTW
ncbi:DUF7284 family protein [Halomarina oriensis]|uniref:Uncharacterized protein n=1 Tax=Halomarina oriensis TaxID=671145 RepID=A0A6B0GTG2_9EURY|nr:hypothetical protein [Halomarina oriensis]MWG35425.1 hypothetical protein [Halomarina oriensis]